MTAIVEVHHIYQHMTVMFTKSQFISLFCFIRAVVPYLRTLEHRINRGHGSEARQGLDVRLLRQQAPALGVAAEGQRAQVLQVQVALSTGWLEQVLAGHHLKSQQSNVKGRRSPQADGKRLKRGPTWSTRAGLVASGRVCSISV